MCNYCNKVPYKKLNSITNFVRCNEINQKENKMKFLNVDIVIILTNFRVKENQQQKSKQPVLN